jgi:ABC-2 type transport system permease protein
MPLAVQYLTFLNPLRYFIQIVRGIFLKGTGVAVLWPQMLALFIIGLSILTFSALQFRKRLDYGYIHRGTWRSRGSSR